MRQYRGRVRPGRFHRRFYRYRSAHYDDSPRPRGLYRSRRGVILGVCTGLAEYLDISVFWTRVVALCLLIFTGFWPIVAIYLLAAVLMKPEPVVPLTSDDDQEFYDSYMNSRAMALSRLKRTYDSLNSRLRRMEDIVTAREFDWERRFNGQ